MSANFSIPEGNFRGHDRQHVWQVKPDPELTEVGPGTPCGEYLRRHWMPVAMTDQVGDLPYRIRILGEDLILFREKAGKLGLVHMHCAHRNMSLEFGIIEEGGYAAAIMAGNMAPTAPSWKDPANHPIVDSGKMLAWAPIQLSSTRVWHSPTSVPPIRCRHFRYSIPLTKTGMKCCPI